MHDQERGNALRVGPAPKPTLTDERSRPAPRKKPLPPQNDPQDVLTDTGLMPVRQRIGNDNLLDAAEGLEREQQTLLEAAPVEQTYQDTLVAYVQAKHTQAEYIEDRLEHLIDQQTVRLAQTRLAQPGVFTMPAAKRAWQTQQTQQRARLQTLRVRLEAVREIKEGMGLHAPRIEELATRKLRAEWPELASDWDAMREALRHHQLHERGHRNEQKRQKEQSAALGQSLSVSRPA